MALAGLLSLLLSLCLTTVKAAPNVVDTGYAKYAGNLTFPNTVAYLGIPYAEPPVGARRFRAPLPLNTTRVSREAGGNVVDASEYPEQCIQGALGAGDHGGAGSEDCLKVNIYSPAGAKRGSNLPVLVYIHGGGYIFGNPRNWPFDHWIHQQPNVVVVSVYYRLDSLGFLAVPELRDPAIGDLNVGFLDQVESLRWVQQNIASFGGNPKKVTINGESAGGGSVTLHLIANGVGQLFSGAIAQSVYRAATPTPEQQAGLFQFYSQRAGCGTGTVPEKIECLRSVSVSALAISQDAAKTNEFGGPFGFRPVIDGKVILQSPTVSILEGKYARVPLVVGATSNETVTGGSDIGVALKRSYPLMTDEDVARILEVYPSEDFASPTQRFRVITGESVLICARPILGTEFGKEVPSWGYRYNQPNPTNSAPGNVGHAAENWMMFLGSNTGVNGSVVFTGLNPTEEKFASELIAYWLSFVRSENPNTFKLSRSPFWGDYAHPGSHSGKRIVLQQTVGTQQSGSFVEVEAQNEFERCEVVGDLAEKQQN